jgi:hypothetical protein
MIFCGKYLDELQDENRLLIADCIHRILFPYTYSLNS